MPNKQPVALDPFVLLNDPSVKAVFELWDKQSWSKDRLDYQLTRITGWLDDELARPEGALLRKQVDRFSNLLGRSLSPTEPPLAVRASTEEMAIFLANFASSFTLTTVTSAATAAHHLSESTALYRFPRLLTKARLERLMDLSPSGLGYLAEVGPDSLRAAFTKDNRDLPDLPLWTGHPLLADRLDVEADQSLLEAANRVLVSTVRCSKKDAEAPLRGAIVSFLASSQPARDKEGLAALYATGRFAVQHPVLIAPKAERAARQLFRVDPDELADGPRQLLDDLLVVLQATGSESSLELRSMVWAAVVEELGLLSEDLDNAENLKRLVALTDQEITTSQVAAYDRLFQLVKAQGDRRHRRKAAVDKAPDPHEASITDLLGLLKSIARKDGSAYRLPGPRSLSPAQHKLIKQVTGQRYDDAFITRMAALGFTRSNASALELYMDDLISRLGEAGVTVLDVDTEVRHGALKNGQSIDHVISVQLPKRKRPLEVLIECQGSQHYVKHNNQNGRFDPVAAHGRDRRKANAIREADDDQSNRRILVMVNHRLLTGAAAHKLLSPVQMAEVMAYAARIGAWWIHVAPKGCKDRPAFPQAATPIRIHGEVADSSLHDVELIYIKRF